MNRQHENGEQLTGEQAGQSPTKEDKTISRDGMHPADLHRTAASRVALRVRRPAGRVPRRAATGHPGGGRTDGGRRSPWRGSPAMHRCASRDCRIERSSSVYTGRASPSPRKPTAFLAAKLTLQPPSPQLGAVAGPRQAAALHGAQTGAVPGHCITADTVTPGANTDGYVLFRKECPDLKTVEPRVRRVQQELRRAPLPRQPSQRARICQDDAGDP